MPGIMHRQDDNELAEGEFLVLFVCRHVYCRMVRE